MRIKNKTTKIKKYKGGSNNQAKNNQPKIKLVTLKKIIIIFNKITKLNSSSDAQYKHDIIKDLMESDIKKLIEEIVNILKALIEKKDEKNLTKRLKDISIHVKRFAPMSNTKNLNDFEKIQNIISLFEEIQKLNASSDEDAIINSLMTDDIQDIIKNVTLTLEQLVKINSKQIREISIHIQSVAFGPQPPNIPSVVLKSQFTNETRRKFNAKIQRNRENIKLATQKIGNSIAFGIERGSELGSDSVTGIGKLASKIGKGFVQASSKLADRLNKKRDLNNNRASRQKKGSSRIVTGPIGGPSANAFISPAILPTVDPAPAISAPEVTPPAISAPEVTPPAISAPAVDPDKSTSVPSKNSKPRISGSVTPINQNRDSVIPNPLLQTNPNASRVTNRRSRGSLLNR